MKAYFEPKMNISVFDKADVVTTSGTIADNFSNGGESGNNFINMTYDQLKGYTDGSGDSTNTARW